MINGALYVREMKKSIKLIVILLAVITMYVAIIISMYEPKMAKLLDDYVKMMPQLMASVGMTGGATSLLGFMCSYLYGFILIVFPMIFCIIRANGLVAKYIDNSSMVSLLCAPVKRFTVAFTQMAVLMSGIVILIVYTTILEIICAQYFFPGELDIAKLLVLNTGLLGLELFIGAICFFASCIFSEVKYSIALGAGLPTLMFVIQMLANVGDKAKNAKYFTFFTLYDSTGIIENEAGAFIGIIVLFAGAIVLYTASVTAFCKRDICL